MPWSRLSRFLPFIQAGPGQFLLLAIVFSLVYCQAPLYYSNQNQYFLHGLAWAGKGLLRDDWLAGTRDPTPVFSALVAFTARYLHPGLFHVYYALLLGAYAFAMLHIFRFLVGPEVAKRRWPAFLVGLLLVHSALARWASYRWLQADQPWFLQAGVAGQYILGPVLQPSTFGVLLVVAVALLVENRPLWAATCIGAAVVLHSTYLLAGGLLTVGVLAVLLARRQYRLALLSGALALALVGPVIVYVLVAFSPTTTEAFRETQHILVTFRIPHHCQPRLWFDAIAAGQIAWVVLAICLVRRTSLACVLGVPFALAVVLTVAQVASGNDTLALLFPWRISSVLVPIATTVVLSRLLSGQHSILDQPMGQCVLGLTAACLVAGGVWVTLTHQGFQTNEHEKGMLEYVRHGKAKGDVYFIPVKAPNLQKTTHGSLSSDFKPLPSKKADPRIIPIDLQQFRLPTEAPLYVDFKSVPYADIDVLEWRRRIAQAEVIRWLLEQGHQGEAIEWLRRKKVTHLVWPASLELTDSRFQKTYADSFYCVYRIQPGSAAR